MKRLFLIIGTALCLCAVNKAMAQSFSVKNGDSIFIYYDIISSVAPYTVAVSPDLDNDNKYKGDIVIPSSVTYDDVTYTVTDITDFAFKDCKELTSVIIPNTVILFHEEVFKDCSGLTSVTLSNSLTEIAYSAFEGCSSLTSVIIPNSVTIITDNAFSGCSKLTSVTLSDSLTEITYNAFYGCSSLASVIIPNSVITIGDHAFYGCSSLTSVTFSDSLTNIGYNAFFGCSSLTSIIIPNSVTDIQSGVFEGCINLKEIHVKAIIPPKIAFSTFTNVPDTVPVYVSCGMANHYRSSDGWSLFTNIIDTIPPYDISVQSDAAMGTVNITKKNTCTDNTAIIMATANTGFHFLKWNDENTDNPHIIILVSDTTITAIFEIAYNVNVLANNDTWGTIIGGNSYPKDSMATIEAIPNAGYRFLKWNDEIIDNPRTISVISDTTLTAIFEIMYNVEVLANDDTWGMVIGENSYPKDSMATIGAIPKDGYRFLKWNDGNTDNPRAITVVSNITFTAIFEIMHKVSISANDNTMGTVSGSGIYPKDSTATINAIPKAGCRFLKWNDENTDNPRTITVVSNITFTAIFEIMHKVSISANDDTMGTVSGSGIYPRDSTATISAIPKAGYHFLKWNDGNTDNPRTIIVTSDMSFIAEFEILYHVDVSANNNDRGFVSGTGDYPENTTITFGAIANQGYYFTHWNDGNTDNPRTVTVIQNATFIATFDVSTDIKEIETSDDINVYPNPVRDNISIQLPDNVYQAVFTLYDIRGKVLIRREIDNQDAISVSNLTAGIYIYNLRTERQNYMGKITKQ
ncbi:MAG: leucine-rich repeat protein [Bacteroidales bacterium]|jgi:hypothetical protein|nr:leucine-rich repeat protein [Bacteroidales bacterium]